MPRKPTGRPCGRKPKEYDPKVFEGLCFIQCTGQEIESVLNGDIESIANWCKRHYGTTYQECHKRFCENGKSSLRRYQFNLAKTNAGMAIWLGKVILGQKDPLELDLKWGRNSGYVDTVKRIMVVDGSKENTEHARHADIIPQTSAEPDRVGCEVQHMDRSGPVREIVCEPVGI